MFWLLLCQLRQQHVLDKLAPANIALFRHFVQSV